MKENSGSGIARRQQLLRQRILIALASSICFYLGSRRASYYRIEETNDFGIQLNKGGEVGLLDDPLDGFLSDKLASNFNPILRGHIRQILSASTNLIKVRLGPHASITDHSYSGIIAEFCPLNFTAQKERPAKFSTFRHVVENSHCGKGSKNIVLVDLKEAIQLAREFDVHVAENIDSVVSSHIPTVLDLKGVVFHESRCGSTLAVNSMMALNPTKNRLYSNAGPPEYAMKICAEGYSKCSVEAAANIMRDVVYMMGRSNDSTEHNLFFVLQPEATRTMETFRVAFPTTPWIFLYREPAEAIMSQDENHPAFSLDPSPMVEAFADRKGYDLDEITTDEMQAIQLATFCLSVLRNLPHEDLDDGLGLAVKYSYDLASDFIDSILPLHFHTPVDYVGETRIRQVAKKYNKKRDGLDPGPPGDKHNEIDAPETIKDAAERFLEQSFNKLQKSRYNLQRCRFFKPSGPYISCPGEDEEEEDD